MEAFLTGSFPDILTHRLGPKVAALALISAVIVIAYLRFVSSSSPDRPVDSRLIIRPQTTYIRALFAGRNITLCLSPTIPGRNTLRLIVPRATHPAEPTLVVTADMPGMPMVPSRTVLRKQGSFYGGAISLPMFGRYRLRINLGGYSSLTYLVLPLPRL